MRGKSKIIVILIIAITIISMQVFNIVLNNKSYNKAKDMFEDGKYYDVFTKYYKQLNKANKEKIEDLLIEKVSNKKWKSQYEMNYTNFTECVGNEYVEIDDGIANHYVICGELRHEYGGVNGESKINITLQQYDDNKVIFDLGDSDNLYLFIYRSNDINIETGSLSSNRNYQMSYSKFDVIEQ